MKAGDKVRIIEKTKHPLNISTDEGLPFVYNGKTIWKRGDIGYISEIYPNGIFLSKTKGGKTEYGIFQEFDLRLLPNLKAGDKVKILQKTAKRWENEYCTTGKGGIGYVIRIGYKGKYVVVNRDPYAFGGDVFNPEDLILINENKKEEKMNNIIEEIKQTYEEFKKNDPHSSVCESLPFSVPDNLWMYYYLFPELLLIYDNWVQEEYKISLSFLTFKEYRARHYSLDGEAVVYPCWVLPEEEVLRIMAESGIL